MDLTPWNHIENALASSAPNPGSQVAALIEQNVVYAEDHAIAHNLSARKRRALLAAFQRWREWAFDMEQRRIQIELF